MTRSMRWISSSAPSLLAIAWVGLPQPRSRMAFAAATRAGGVAFGLRMTATSTFSAVRVWLRASERISVTALGIFGFFGLLLFLETKTEIGWRGGPPRRTRAAHLHERRK